MSWLLKKPNVGDLCHTESWCECFDTHGNYVCDTDERYLHIYVGDHPIDVVNNRPSDFEGIIGRCGLVYVCSFIQPEEETS